MPRTRVPFNGVPIPPAAKDNINEDLVNKSVTKLDHLVDVRKNGAGSVFYFNIPNYGGDGGALYTGNSNLPIYWSHQRDRVLRATPFMNGTWANALGMWISKIASQSWELKGIRIQRFQEMLLNGWTDFISKCGRDFLTTDNGCFFEIVRASNAAGSRILGIVPLDSCRVTRTGDPDYPAIYLDWMGHLHAMASYEICMMSDMPSSANSYYGTGISAATRSFDYIVTLQSVEQLIQEKTSGSQPTGISFVNAGIDQDQFRDALNSGKESRIAEGYIRHMGVILIPLVNLDANPTIATVPLKSLPEGYQAEEVSENCQRNFANALGLDPQIINPRLIGSGSRGTSAQSTILREEQQGLLPSLFKKELTHLLNQNVLPNAVTFYFGVRDLSDELKQAQINNLDAETRSVQIASGEIDASIARQLAVEKNQLSPRYIDSGSIDQPLSDSDQPDEVKVELAQPIDKLEAQPDATLETKELSLARKQLFQQAIDRAWSQDELSQAALAMWQQVLEQSDMAHLLVMQQQPIAKGMYHGHNGGSNGNGDGNGNGNRSLGKKEIENLVLRLMAEQARTAPAPQVLVVQPNTPPIHVHTPPIEIKEAAAPNITLHPQSIVVNVPAQAAPIVNIEPAQVNVNNHVPVPEVRPNINVSTPAPNVVVDNKFSPEIRVDVPEQAAPQITVEMPQRERLTVHRDREGRISEIDAE